MSTGILYGIGVGPGAPDLLTIRAVNILKNNVDVILSPASPSNEYSTALDIARPYLKSSTEIVRLDFPMTKQKEKLHEAWEKAGTITADILQTKKNAAFLTLGDPLIYSTFSYLLRAVKKIMAKFEIRIVPGITSFQAAAAKIQRPLCESEEDLRIISGIIPQDKLVDELERPGNCAILKVYRNIEAIKSALEQTGREKNCVCASYVERQGERINMGTPQEKPPYMSLILSYEEE